MIQAGSRYSELIRLFIFITDDHFIEHSR